MDPLNQPLALLALPLLLWLLTPAPRTTRRLHPLAEALLVVALSAAVTTAASAWLWAWHAVGGNSAS